MIASNSTTTPASHEELFRQFAGALQDHLDLKSQVDESDVRRIAAEEVDKARLPRPLAITVNDGPTVTLTDRVHCQFTEVMDLVAEGHENIFLVGPAGSGKTTLAKSVAKALGLEFGFLSLSAGVTETHLFGRMLPKADGTWGYVESVFVRIYRNGGLFLLDEMDAADANVMVSINAALANGELCNPVTGEIIPRHPKCCILAAANTWGQGGDHQYVGRNALDAATLDRFVLTTLHVRYDCDLEAELVRSALSEGQADELLAWVERLRDRITDARLRRVASTRLLVRSAKAMAHGKTLADVKARYYVSWSRDELAKVAEA
jgi:cobaltochelatase CobS